MIKKIAKRFIRSVAFFKDLKGCIVNKEEWRVKNKTGLKLRLMRDLKGSKKAHASLILGRRRWIYGCESLV